MSEKIAVIIPCYKVNDHVLDLLSKIPKFVDNIYCIDDFCPNFSGKLIEKQTSDKRIRVLYHEENKGVGKAVMTGYFAAHDDGCDIAVKIDGDGQMDPELIPNFIDPIIKGRSDYTKGNRFFSLDGITKMPKSRLLGNAILSFITKVSSGYWNIFDPTNGFTAIHLSLIEIIDFKKVANGYFFESDLLFRLNINRCVVTDIPMKAIYNNEKSSLKISRILFPFIYGHIRNFIKRIFYNYFLRDFHFASIEFVLGPILVIAGVIMTLFFWYQSFETNIYSSAGLVMICALPQIIGVQLSLSALNFDIQNIPKEPLHMLLKKIVRKRNS